MPDLQTAFYIIAIVYMGVMFIMMIVLLIIALVIKSKIDAARRTVDHKVAQAKAAARKATFFFKTFKYFVRR